MNQKYTPLECYCYVCRYNAIRQIMNRSGDELVGAKYQATIKEAAVQEIEKLMRGLY